MLATFHSLLRRTIPDLRTYFDDEGLDITPYVKGWLESLFSGQMKLSDGGCLRLWDAYFSSSAAGVAVNASEAAAEVPNGNSKVTSDGKACGNLCTFASQSPLSLHVYVCLALLLQHKDTLEELDRSECEAFLRGLPDDLEVEKILNEAANLRLSHRQAVLAGGDGDGDVFLGGAAINGHGEGEDGGEEDEASGGDEVAQEGDEDEDDGGSDSQFEDADDWGGSEGGKRNGAAHSAGEVESDDDDEDGHGSGLDGSIYSHSHGREEALRRGRLDARAGSVPVEDDWR